MKFRTHSDGTTRLASGARTQAAARTGLTVLHRELDLDDLVLAVIDSWRPTDTGVALGTGGLLSLPVDVKLACGKAGLLLGLPFDIGVCGADQAKAIILLASVQQLGIDIAGIDDMLVEQQVLLLEPFMKAVSYIASHLAHSYGPLE